MTRILQLENCNDCPHKSGVMNYYCKHPLVTIRLAGGRTESRPLPLSFWKAMPEWCPLERVGGIKLDFGGGLSVEEQRMRAAAGALGPPDLKLSFVEDEVFRQDYKLRKDGEK